MSSTHDHKENEPHTHIAADGTIYTHSHGDAEHRESISTHTHTAPDGTTYTHTHVAEDGSVYTHTHIAADGSVHSHTHDPKTMKAILNRLSRSIGHLESVKRMIERGEDCSDVLVQMAAVRAEITNAGKVLLKEHLEHCIVDAVAAGDKEAVEKMNGAIDKFMK